MASTTRRAMARIQATDAAGEIEIPVAVHVLDDGAFSLGNEYGRGVKCGAHDGSVTAAHELARAWAGNWSA